MSGIANSKARGSPCCCLPRPPRFPRVCVQDLACQTPSPATPAFITSWQIAARSVSHTQHLCNVLVLLCKHGPNPSRRRLVRPCPCPPSEHRARPPEPWKESPPRVVRRPLRGDVRPGCPYTLARVWVLAGPVPPVLLMAAHQQTAPARQGISGVTQGTAGCSRPAPLPPHSSFPSPGLVLGCPRGTIQVKNPPPLLFGPVGSGDKVGRMALAGWNHRAGT